MTQEQSEKIDTLAEVESADYGEPMKVHIECAFINGAKRGYELAISELEEKYKQGFKDGYDECRSYYKIPLNA